MRERGGKPARAFTLLELLVVAAITGVMMTLTVGLLRAGMTTSSRSAMEGLAQDQARRTVEAIAREMKDSSEASMGWEVGVTPNPYTQYYDNEVSRIRFSRCVGYDAVNDLRLWGPMVTFAHTPPSAGEPGYLMRIENGVQTRVCDHVSAFTVRYVPDERLVIISVTVEYRDPEDAMHLIASGAVARVRLRN